MHLYIKLYKLSLPRVIEVTDGHRRGNDLTLPLTMENLEKSHSPTFPSLHPSHNSFSSPSVALPTSQLILQLFRCFTYVAAHSSTLLSLLLRHRLSLTPPSEPPMRYSPTFPSFHLSHNSFSSSSVALPTSQLILQPFRCFTYVTARSLSLLSLLLSHRLFTYVTWRASHGKDYCYILQSQL